MFLGYNPREADWFLQHTGYSRGRMAIQVLRSATPRCLLYPCYKFLMGLCILQRQVTYRMFRQAVGMGLVWHGVPL